MDTSIYEEIKETLLLELQKYEKIEKLDTVLYIVDTEMHNKILEMKERLKLEYSYVENFQKLFSIDTIIKYLNEESSVHTYSLGEKTFHRQINDPEKVLNLLDSEFVIWKKRLKKDIQKKLAQQQIPKELVAEKMKELDIEIAKAQEEHNYIMENFDSLDVRINSLHKRPSVGVVIRFRLDSNSQSKTIRLKNSIPNVLHFVERTEHTYSNNKISEFLNSAINPYGDVYYKKIED